LRPFGGAGHLYREVDVETIKVTGVEYIRVLGVLGDVWEGKICGYPLWVVEHV